MCPSSVSHYRCNSSLNSDGIVIMTKLVKIPSKSTKNVLLLGVSTCCATSFECLRHIRLSLQQNTAYPSMTSKPYSLSHFEHCLNWYFSIHSLWQYIINSFTSLIFVLVSIWLTVFPVKTSHTKIDLISKLLPLAIIYCSQFSFYKKYSFLQEMQ